MNDVIDGRQVNFESGNITTKSGTATDAETEVLSVNTLYWSNILVEIIENNSGNGLDYYVYGVLSGNEDYLIQSGSLLTNTSMIPLCITQAYSYIRIKIKNTIPASDATYIVSVVCKR